MIDQDTLIPLGFALTIGGAIGSYVLLNYRVRKAEEKTECNSDEIKALKQENTKFIGIEKDIKFIKEILVEVKKKLEIY